MVVGSFCVSPSALRIFLKCFASCAALLEAIYSASVEDRATVFWSFELQLTGDPLTLKIYAVVDLPVSVSTVVRVTMPSENAFVLVCFPEDQSLVCCSL